MNRPRTRPPPPPYPRPVETVHAEEIGSCSDDEHFISRALKRTASQRGAPTSSDTEEARRAAKRRRIELHAASYLRGEQLYIQSAQLRGPFESGWRNPWAKKKKGHKQDAGTRREAFEVPETTARKRQTEVASEASIRATEQKPNFKTMKRALSPAEQDTPTPRSSPMFRNIGSITGTPTRNLDRQPINSKESRVADWLKTNAFVKKLDVVEPSSPTPRRVSRRPDHITPGAISTPVRTLTKEQVVAQNFDGAGSRSPIVDKVAAAQALSYKITPDAEGNTDGQVVEAATDTSRIPISAQAIVRDVSRAEHAIVHARQKSLLITSNTPNASPFEYRRLVPGGTKSSNGAFFMPTNHPSEASHVEHDQADQGKSDSRPGGSTGPKTTEQRSDLATEDDLADDIVQRGAQLDQHTRTEREPVNELPVPIVRGSSLRSNHHSEGEVTKAIPPLESSSKVDVSSRIGLSTAVSDVSLATLLPSAQQRTDLLRQNSSLVRDDQLLEAISNDGGSEQNSVVEVILNLPIASGGEHESRGEDGLPLVGAAKVENSLLDESKRFDPVDKPTTPLNPPPASTREMSTQELIAAIEPVTFSTLKKKTPRQRSSSVERDHAISTTNSTAKVRAAKKTKKASFASDLAAPPTTSYDGSIKSAMKAKVSKELRSPPPLRFNKKIDGQEAEEQPTHLVPSQGNLSRISSSMPSVGGDLPPNKGILKGTKNVASSPSRDRRDQKTAMSSGGVGARDASGAEHLGSLLASGQNGVLHNDYEGRIGAENFDLDAAIDDLGSFLGTWDADQEASTLSSH